MSLSEKKAKPKRYSYPDYNGTISVGELRKLPRHQKLEVMKTWFCENYEDPVHHAPWAEGEYVYIHGGPYDAAEELGNEFGSLISEEIINELADELNDECTEWAGHPEYEPDERDYPMPPTQPLAAFNEAIAATRSLLQIEIPASNTQHFLRLLYGNVITALETYLSDFLIAVLKSKPWYLRTFVEKNKDFAEQKFGLNEVYAKMAQIEKVAFTALRDTLWHNLPKAAAIYGFTLKVKFPLVPELLRAVDVRHDIVHRSGKNKEGVEHVLNSIQIENVIAQAEALVADIEKQWKGIEWAEMEGINKMFDE